MLMLGVQEFLSAHISNPWIIVFILGFMPLAEVRVAIIYGLLAGLDPQELLAAAIAANILEVPLVFYFLGKARVMNHAYRLLGKRAEKHIDKSRTYLDKYGAFALIIAVATPLPGTGAALAAFISEMLKLDRKKAFLAIMLGIIISATLVFLAAAFFKALLKIFF